MRFREQPSALVFSLLALGLAALIGLVLPTAGGLGSAANLHWTPPPAATATLRPTQPAAAPTATRSATDTATATAQVLPTATATLAPSPTATTAQPIETATPTAGPQAKARFLAGPVNLRSGPGTDYSVLGMAKAGEEYVVQGRSADSRWVQVCCVAGAPAWALAELVSLPADLNSFPVVP